MTQVSKKFLRQEIEEKVYETFWETIVKMNKKDDASAFFSEFFSRTEKTNFAKRLSIAILLHKGYQWRTIADILKVSLATIAKMASKAGTKGFKVYFEKLDRDEAWREFWVDLGKTYVKFLHPEKTVGLDDEGVERIYMGKKKTF
mgnify:CR=1 FL=1